MRRNIAFFITTNHTTEQSFLSAKAHFYKTVNEFNYEIKSFKTKSFNIFIAYNSHITFSKQQEFIYLPIGNLNDNPLENDRFLKIQIDNKNEIIEITNDYAGSIPVYYSARKHFSISNIEPCVMLDSGSSEQDFSYENIYGFLKYSHFIWDETAFKHIFVMTPDSKYEFQKQDLTIKSEYLKTAKSSTLNISLSDKKVAEKLNDLNNHLVERSLSKYDKIILPLSAGYDSRMILAAISKNESLLKNLFCFTYGAIGSVEVEAARRLSETVNIYWKFIDLPKKFLTKQYLLQIHNVFGSSLHMHGMYQLEFFNEIKKYISLTGNGCLTSGFMTGVPAGQHNGLLKINSLVNTLTDKMNKFSQSKLWSLNELKNIELFKNKNHIHKAEERFRLAFNRFDGEIHQKAVMFDIWTRQRNFIGYYPRTLEWKISTVSPHMNTDYINFFMSISKKHLNNRYAVELMFSHCHPKLSKIISNSNGLKSITSKKENIIFFISRILKQIKLNKLLPTKYINNSFNLNLPAIKKCSTDSIYPLLEKQYTNKIINKIMRKEQILNFYNNALSGSIKSYSKLITIQSLALSTLKMEAKDALT